MCGTFRLGLGGGRAKQGWRKGKQNRAELGDLGLHVLRAHMLVAGDQLQQCSDFQVQLMVSRSFQAQYKDNHCRQMTSGPHGYTLSLPIVAKTWLKQLLPRSKPSLWSCCCSSHHPQVRREISYPEYRFLELFFLMTRHTTIEMSGERPVTVPMTIPATMAMGNAGRLSGERREKTFNSSAFPD